MRVFSCLFLSSSGVDRSRVDDCMRNAGGTEGDGKNSVLEGELVQKVCEASSSSAVDLSVPCHLILLSHELGYLRISVRTFDPVRGFLSPFFFLCNTFPDVVLYSTTTFF